MDASSSIGPKNWKVQTSFVENITKHFTVAPSRVCFGALIFYETSHKIFDLRDHLDNDAVSKSIREIQYPNSSGTFTHSALQEVIKQDMFGTAAGGREKAPDILIVVTDGLSIYPKKTIEAANLVKSKNIIVVAIGVGKETSRSELEAIASDKSLVFSVHDYNVLQGIQNDLVRIACKPTTVMTTTTTEELTTTEQPSTTTTKQTTTTYEEEEICDVEQGDIIFVMDASSSIGPKNWKVQTSFVENITKHFTVAPSRVCFGAMIFYKTSHKIFDLRDHKDNDAISKAVREIQYPNSSGTFTHSALQEVIKQDMFGTAAGGREKAPDILIVVTDGMSIYPKKTIEAANLVKGKNITVVTIGIGKETSRSELEAIASDKSLVFSVHDYSVLQEIQNDLVRIACKPTIVITSTTASITTTTEEPTTLADEQTTTTTAFTRPPYPPSTPLPCVNTSKADIIFIIDASTSIGNKKWRNQTQFAAGITRYFDVEPNVRFGAILFHKYPEKIFDLKDYQDHDSLFKAILAIPYANIWGTYTDKALEFVHNVSLFSPEAGGRDDVPNIAILMTDGNSTYMNKTIAAANKLKVSDNVTIIAVGIGKDVNKVELSSVASRPEYAIYTQDYTLLDHISHDLVTLTCEKATIEMAENGKPTTTSATTTTTEEPTTTTEEPTTTTEEPTTTTEEPTTTKEAMTTTTEEPTTTTTKKTTTTTFTRPPYPPSTPLPCVNTSKADIIFIIDASTSIGNKKWRNQTQFAASITQYFSVEPNVRFGTILFHKYPEKVFDLKDYSNHSSLSKAILGIPYANIWGTYTDKALEFVHNASLFSPEAGGRDDVPNIAILMTDGNSTNMNKTIAAANKLKASDNVTIITVGIGKDVNKAELSAVASRPEYTFYSQDYTLLDYISHDLVTLTCEKATLEMAKSGQPSLNLDVTPL